MTIKLNAGQQKAFEGFKAFMADPNATCAVLTGAAGTGKTTCLQVILKESGIDTDHVIACAPTHKATNVLRDTLSFIIPQRNINTVTSNFYGYNEDGNYYTLSADMEKTVLAVIDEASMLGKKRTLDIIEIAKYWGKKVLFVGDPFQLEPIKDSDVVFTYDMTKYYWSLSQVMRQREGSDLLNLVTAIRDQKQILIPDASVEDVKISSGDDAIRSLATDLRNGISAIAVDFKNADRFDHNAEIRIEMEYPIDVVVGEQMIATNNAIFEMGDKKVIPVPNATIFEATPDMKSYGTFQVAYFMPSDKIADQVGGTGIEGNYSGYSSRILFQVQASFFSDIILLEGERTRVDFVCLHRQPEPTVNDGFIACDRLPRKIQEKFCRLGKTNHWNLRTDVIVCNFGYSITAHKAQGSQWDKVYVTSVKPNDYRWGYTAISRAKREVILALECANVMTWNQIRGIADEYVSGKNMSALAECDMEKMVRENQKRRKAEELSMMLRTKRGKTLADLGFGVVEKVDDRCERLLNDICAHLDLDAKTVIQEAFSKQKRLYGLVEMMGDLILGTIKEEQKAAKDAIKKGIEMLAAIRIRKEVLAKLGNDAQEINYNKVVFFDPKNDNPFIDGELQDAVNHQFNRNKAVEIRLIGEEGYGEKSIVIDGEAVRSVLNSVKDAYGTNDEYDFVREEITMTENENKTVSMATKVEKKEEEITMKKENKAVDMTNTAQAEIKQVEEKEEVKMEEKTIVKIYIMTMGGRYPFDAARDEGLIKSLVARERTDHDWDDPVNNEIYEIVLNGNKAMMDADKAAKKAVVIGWSMRTYYGFRGLKAVEPAPVVEEKKEEIAPVEEKKEEIYISPAIDPDEYAIDIDAAVEVEKANIAYIKALENGRRVAEIAAIDHYVITTDAQDYAVEAEQETIEMEQKKTDMIRHIQHDGFVLPENYETMSYEALYDYFMDETAKADAASEYAMDEAAMKDAEPEIIEIEPVEEKKEEKKVKKAGVSRKEVMEAAHKLRRKVAPEFEKNGIMYKEIMSICLKVAWASAKGEDVNKEFPWFMGVLTNVIVREKMVAINADALKDAQETAKKAAEQRKLEAEKREAARKEKAARKAAKAAEEKAKKEDEARKREALMALRRTTSQVVLSAYDPDFIKAAKENPKSDAAVVVRGITEDLIALNATEKAGAVMADMKASLAEFSWSLPVGMKKENGVRKYYMVRNDGAIMGAYKFVTNNEGEIELADA